MKENILIKKPIESLQENASGFFDKIYAKHSASMKCSAGCSKCCFTDISVFEVEADRIREWFTALPPEERQQIAKLWAIPVVLGACSFLIDNKCTIYEARPVICRTQGAPLFLQSENVLDYCPLNFEKEDPPKEDWLNLERLNTLLSFAAKTSGKEGRIRLKKLKDNLLLSLL
jgi:Fe-S-cluster containining protein